MTLPKPLHTRRRFLARAGALGLATPFGLVGSPSSAGLLPVPGLDGAPICRVAAEGPAPAGALRPIKLAWNASAICTAAAPVAKESGVFARHGLDVEFVNFGGSTEQLLEAIATGKADAGIGMALRWLKPLEQGFDVKVTAGIHGGCMRLLGATTAGATSLEALKGKVIAVSDQASPAKNFFSLLLAKRGIDPERDVEWRVYPLDLLNLAVEKGEAQALADGDPRTFLWMKDTRLTEVANNLSAEYRDRTCCVLAVRGSLVRDERPVATALTRALLESGASVAHDPAYAAKVFAGYGGKGSVEELAAMLRSHTHHHHPLGAELKQQIAAYVDELKIVKVIRARTDARQFAERVTADVLS
ncbi:ABC transporter substrate-binding protein [Methylobacterium nonmethylotrophicum]|uniref:ABC transporter substrate-binding protein n=1 Tax=Methylobacterium nonmethylotrophicum TaxID=1141884 RepID=A0A4Z0NX21_9HYPH|nr:ABC transporter substrate-binding protein [Methylobacterium nonmethylotrophicum]TGE01119.1 ABC transporter substrate-binding protein [Methylobacterium nonmethylotrophicum]